MKTKEKTAIEGMSMGELKNEHMKLSLDLVTMKRERYTKQSKNVKAAKNIRLRRAIVSTILRQKELAV
ncbi:hypothetical protein HY947_04490 [Candidatus Gottesmanbacteria bacterium]|nr:hypothetical protein [Candidatus Gottesmanbacteria bacterium]